MSNNNNRVTNTKAGLATRMATAVGLKKKKHGVEIVERGNVTGLYGIVDTYKRQIPKLQQIRYACNNELEDIVNAKDMDQLTRALGRFQESLYRPIAVTVSPDNETTNKYYGKCIY